MHESLTILDYPVPSCQILNEETMSIKDIKILFNRNLIQNPRESRGDELHAVRIVGITYRRWRVSLNSPVYNQFVPIERHIRNILQEHPDLETGPAVHYTLCLLGQQDNSIRPEVVIHCGDKQYRDTAVRIVKKSPEWRNFVQHHPSFVLRTSSKAPRLLSQPIRRDEIRQHIDNSAYLDEPSDTSEKSLNVRIPSDTSSPRLSRPEARHSQDDPTSLVSRSPRSSSSGRSVYCDGTQALSLGSPIILFSPTTGAGSIAHRVARAGVTLRVGKELFMLTVSHPLIQPSDIANKNHLPSNQLRNKDDCQIFLFDQHFEGDIFTSQDVLTNEGHVRTASSSVSSSYLQPMLVGDIAHQSSSLPLQESDWMLCKLNDNTYQKYKAQGNVNRVEFDGRHVSVHDISEMPSKKVNVLAVTHWKRPQRAILFPTPSYYRMPGSRRFLQVLSIQLEEPLVPGDSGTSIVDSATGVWYGHLIASDDDGVSGYMLPGTEIINSIAQGLGVSPTDVRIERTSYGQSRSLTPTSTSAPAPSSASALDQVPLGDFNSLARLILERQNILSISWRTLKVEACDAYRIGDRDRAESCIQGLLIIRHCQKNRLTHHGSLEYIARLARGETSQFDAEFEKVSETLANAARTPQVLQRRPSMNTPSAKQTTAIGTNVSDQSATSHSTPIRLRSSPNHGIDVSSYESVSRASYQDPERSQQDQLMSTNHSTYPSTDHNQRGQEQQSRARRQSMAGSDPRRSSSSILRPIPGEDILQRPLVNEGFRRGVNNPHRPPAGTHPSLLHTASPETDRGYGSDYSVSTTTARSVDTSDVSGSYLGEPQIDERHTTTGDERYTVRRDASKFFRPGRVFKIVWHSPADSNGTGTLNADRDVMQAASNSHVHSKPTFLLAVVQKNGYSICCPISTYENDGLVRKNMQTMEIQAQAIIYSSTTHPESLPGEPRLRKDPIPVDMVRGHPLLDKSSRVRFAKSYTVAWNVHVMNVGQVSEGYDEVVRHYFLNDFAYRE